MNVDALWRALSGRTEGRLARDVALARFTTYRLGGPAALYFEPSVDADLLALADALAGDDVPILVLGRGSNLVVSDAGWPGVAIRLGQSFSHMASEGADGVRTGAAASLPVLANWAARRGLSGLEFSVGVPGSVGGAVRMNAGAHDQDVAAALASARIVELSTGRVRDVPAAELALGYRSSNLRLNDVVTEALFRLAPTPPMEVRARMDQFRRHRAATQPGALQNAGSTFKNPPGDFAGRLVEAAGLKGFRVGGVEVSGLHANFFVASDDASAQDVYDLVQAVGERVRERFGVVLEPEVRFAGRFDAAREVAP